MARDFRTEVIAAHFRYGTTAEPLRIRAYAQLVLKALFLVGDEPQSLSDIRHSVVNLTGGASPSEEDLLSALRLLRERNQLRDRNGRYLLKSAPRRELDEQLSLRRRRIASVVERHFPTTGTGDAITAWFDRMCTLFMVRHSHRWVASLTRGAALPPVDGTPLETEAMTVAEVLGVDADPRQLLSGFERFLRSEDPEDNQHLWSIGMAGFAARLVAAGAGADPITTDELRGRRFLLDTNVLISLALGQDRFAPAWAALGRALKAIDAKVGYIYDTREEYQGVVDSWGSDVLKAIETKGAEVVRGAHDPYIVAAVSRGCVIGSHYQTFFDELREPATSIGDEIQIEFWDDPEVAEAARAGRENNARVIAIQNFWKDRRPRPKTRERAQHDSAVTETAKVLTGAGEVTNVLTLDVTMHDLALQWSKPDGEPMWISLDAIVQVLALDQSGPEVDATEFAPLLASLVTHDFEVPQGEYQLEDLRWLDELEQDVTELPAGEVRGMAKEIHRLRLAGRSRTDPELRLGLQRLYQKAKATVAADVSEARKREAKVLDDLDDERKARIRDRAVFVDDEVRRLRRSAKVRWWVEGAVWVLLFIILGVVGAGLIRSLIEPGDLRGVLELGAVVLTPALGSLSLIFSRVIPGYKRDMSTLRERAEANVGNRLRVGRADESAGHDFT